MKLKKSRKNSYYKKVINRQKSQLFYNIKKILFIFIFLPFISMNYGTISITAANRFFNGKIEQLQKYISDGYVDIYDDYMVENTKHYERHHFDKYELTKCTENLEKLFTIQAELISQDKSNFEKTLWNWRKTKTNNDSGFQDDSIENSRMNEWPEFNPFEINDAKWHNGEIIKQRTQIESQNAIEEHMEMTKDLKIWKKDLEQEKDERITANVTYLNIPHMKTRNVTNNIMHSITMDFPNTLLFVLSEVYYRETMQHIYAPPGYTLIFHKGGSIKTSAILYRNVEYMQVEQLNLCGFIYSE
mgnify:CR=1 FL=1